MAAFQKTHSQNASVPYRLQVSAKGHAEKTLTTVSKTLLCLTVSPHQHLFIPAASNCSPHNLSLHLVGPLECLVRRLHDPTYLTLSLCKLA
jgi:hypothetical protein